MTRPRRIFRKARRFASLSRGERTLLLRAFPTVVALRLALWLLHPAYVFGRVETSANRKRKNPGDGPAVAGIAWAVEASSRWIPDASCLVQALAGRLLLSRNGYPSTLRIGVARKDGVEFQAHAWVEVDGVAVIGGGDTERYVPFPDVAGVLSANTKRFKSLSPR